MLSEHDRVVLDEIDRELSETDPVLATEFAEWEPRAVPRARRAYLALVAVATLLMVLGVLLTQPAVFWAGVLVLAGIFATRRWWPHRRD